MKKKLKDQNITFTLMEPVLVKNAKFKYVTNGKITMPIDFLTNCVIEDYKQYYWLKVYDDNKKFIEGWYLKEDPRPYMAGTSILAYIKTK